MPGLPSADEAGPLPVGSAAMDYRLVGGEAVLRQLPHELLAGDGVRLLLQRGCGGIRAMPLFEYLVGVTPPGGRGRRYHRGIIYWPSNNEERAAQRAIEDVVKRFGYNIDYEHSCVLNQLDVEEY